MDGALWLKSLHIMAFTAWMAGMWYLPRLMVYHSTVPAESDTSETFKVMERRLLRAITTPAMIVALLAGIVLASVQGQWGDGWLHGKLLLVEEVIPPGNVPSYGKLSDLNMLVSPGGQERTEAEYRALYEAAGFALTRIILTRSRVSVIEGTPV